MIYQNRGSIIPEFLEHILEHFTIFHLHLFPIMKQLKKIHVENFANSNLLELLVRIINSLIV